MSMILQRSSLYAIQAMLYLATRRSGRYVMCREISLHLGLPRPYLSKLMQQFVHANMVESSRGPAGGFRLGRRPDRLRLKEIVEVASGERVVKECLLGFKDCSDETACALHCQWRPVKQELLALLEELSIAKLARAVRQGHYQLSELNLDVLAQRPPRSP